MPFVVSFLLCTIITCVTSGFLFMSEGKTKTIWCVFLVVVSFRRDITTKSYLHDDVNVSNPIFQADICSGHFSTRMQEGRVLWMHS